MDPWTISLIFTIATMVASYAIQSLTQQAPTKPKASGLEDFDFPQVEEGTPQPVVFGDCWLTGWTVLWYGNLRNSAIKSSGGKK